MRALDQLETPCLQSQAACAAEAMALVEAGNEYDLVLTDLMLPDMSGFSLVSVLAHRFPTIPVVVVSALADEASVKRALKAGAAGLFLKPCHQSSWLVRSVPCWKVALSCRTT